MLGSIIEAAFSHLPRLPVLNVSPVALENMPDTMFSPDAFLSTMCLNQCNPLGTECFLLGIQAIYLGI